MDFKYECLLMINKKNQSALFNLCDDEKDFLKILEKERIGHNGNKLKFEENEYEFTLKTNLILNKEERYFHLEIKCENEEKLKDYIKFLKELRKIFNNHKFGVEILRDDLPLYYSEKAYVLINKVENHMRKFIKYFLITKVGINWIEETTPKEIEKAIKDKEDRDIEDKLKRLDFIELGDFLFKKYSKKNISELQKLVNEKKELDSDLFKEFIQESNWEKYFKENIKCENDYLKTRWEKLYIYRNNIAHNKNFDNADLNEVERLSKEVNEKLKEAFDGIDKIKDNDIDKLKVKHVLNSLNNSTSIYENEILKASYLGLNNSVSEYAKKIAGVANLNLNELTSATYLGLNNSVSEYAKVIASINSLGLGNFLYENETQKAFLELNDLRKELKK